MFDNIFSAATFCFLVPLLIEPALATLQHKFMQTNCSTVSGTWSWSWYIVPSWVTSSYEYDFLTKENGWRGKISVTGVHVERDAPRL